MARARLADLERDVLARLRELRPLVDEYHELVEVARRLGHEPPAPAKRAAAGQRETQLLAMVRSCPGITVREISERLSVDRTGLYHVVRRLERSGRLRKDGAQLYPDTTRGA